ncbi:MAG: phosphotransferase [Deltaproteobacteria bacterium]|nr:phosphotransferase [Deltaproteobacteria bacterium]
MVKKTLEELVGEKIQASFGSGARLRSITPLAGDASTRRYYRALLEGHRVPRSVIVMELVGSSLPLSSEELAIFKEPPKELPFLNLHRFLGRVGVRIPALYGHWVEEGILLLEDLGDSSLWDTVQDLSASEVIQRYEKAIDQLLLIQIGGTKARDNSCIAFEQRFDFRLYMWEFSHFIEYGLEKRPGGTISSREKELLVQSFEEISRRLNSQPPCLNHRDYHSWNLMVSDEEIAVIDFQDALLAPPQYDLASLLNDRETDRVIRPDMEDSLLDYYLKKRGEMGEKKVTKDEFFELYLLSALQRDFKVVGRFHYLDLVKGKPGYKKYLPPTLKRLKRNLLRLPQTERLVPLLAAHFEEMR